MGAVAVPQSTVASQPALQWVRMLIGAPGCFPFASPAMMASPALPIDLLISTSSSAISAARAKAASMRRSGPRGLSAGHHPIQRPFEIDRRGPCRMKRLIGTCQRPIARVLASGQRHSIGGGGADQRSAPDLHVADGPGSILNAPQADDFKPVRKFGLVDDLHRPAITRRPDRPVMFAVDIHGWETSKQQSRTFCNSAPRRNEGSSVLSASTAPMKV